MLVIFSIVILGAAVAFGIKLFEFFSDFLDKGGIGFAGSHLLTYVLVAGGFLLLLLFALLSGHFSDIEQPKFDLI